MHIQKILNLVKDAPTVALWWSKNKRLSKYWSFALCAVRAPLGLIGGISCAVVGFMMGISMMGGGVDTDVEIASICLIALGSGLFSFAAMWLLTWYCPKILQCKGLKCHQEACKVDQQQQVKALNTTLKITDPQIKELLGVLQQLKDLDLPNVWWKQFILHTQAAYEQQNHELKKSAPQQIPADHLNDVYIEIQRQWIENQAPVTPKVLKL